MRNIKHRTNLDSCHGAALQYNRHILLHVRGCLLHRSEPSELCMMVQGFLLGALSVLLVDGACRTPLLAAEPGLTTLIKLSSRLPGYSQPWQGQRRTLAARTLCSCIQRDSHVRGSLIASGLWHCQPTLASWGRHFAVHFAIHWSFCCRHSGLRQLIYLSDSETWCMTWASCE